MHEFRFYSIGSSPACRCAVQALTKAGIPFADALDHTVTHLLLDIPSFHSEAALNQFLPSLSKDVILIGGKLPAALPYAKIDLLEDDFYLEENAAVTAECALRVAFAKLPCTLRNANVLIIGWGRIGKHLSRLLAALGANVSVCSRSIPHQAEIASLGLSCVDRKATTFSKFRVAFNTAPGVVIPRALPSDILKIELASKPGFLNTDVIPANGLPGRFAPESSGALIARTILRKCEEEAK